MKKLYDDLDKLDEKLKRVGSYDIDREPCFAEISIDSCSALKDKNCFECGFYKPTTSQIKVMTQDVLKEIDSYRGLIPNQTLKTLRGQVLAGDVDGARKGLDKTKKMRGL